MLLLVRHWLLPGRLRRMPFWARPILLAPAAFALFMIVVQRLPIDSRLNLNLRYIGDVSEFWILGWFPLLIAVASLIGGTLTVAVERQNMRLEEMAVTRLTARQIVHAQFAVRAIQLLVVLMFPYLATVVRQLYRDWPPSRNYPPWTPMVVPWSLIEVIAKPITLILLGMLISCSVKRVQTALAIAGGVISAYAAVFVISEHYYYGHSYGSSASSDEHFYAHLFYWPVSLFDTWDHYFWRLDLQADGLLGIALPISCYLLCRWLCGRRT
jgi:hypothetical protein